MIRADLIAALEELASVTVVGSASDELGAVHWLSDAHDAVEFVIVDIFLKSGFRVAGVPAQAARPLSTGSARPVPRASWAPPKFGRGSCTTDWSTA